MQIQIHLPNNRRDLHSFNFKYKWSNLKMSTFSLTNYKAQSQLFIYAGWTVNGSTPLKRYIKFKHKSYSPQSLQCILRGISVLSNAKSIFSPGFSHVRKNYNVFSINFETESETVPLHLGMEKDHDAFCEGPGRETTTKIKMAGRERTGFVQTNPRRKKTDTGKNMDYILWKSTQTSAGCSDNSDFDK